MKQLVRETGELGRVRTGAGRPPEHQQANPENGDVIASETSGAALFRAKLRKAAQRRRQNRDTDEILQLAEFQLAPDSIPHKQRSRHQKAYVHLIGFPLAGVALAGLFALGYFGSQMVVGMMNRDNAQIVVAQPLPAKLTVSLPVMTKIDALPAAPVSTPDQPEPDIATVLVAPTRAATQPTEPAAPVEEDAVPTGLEKAALLVGEGHAFLAKGDVKTAREHFSRGLELGLPEAALALGRTYDPGYLAQLPRANAEADIAKATAMYRDWYRRSVETGAVAPAAQLDRLIRSMNRQH